MDAQLVIFQPGCGRRVNIPLDGAPAKAFLAAELFREPGDSIYVALNGRLIAVDNAATLWRALGLHRF